MHRTKYQGAHARVRLEGRATPELLTWLDVVRRNARGSGSAARVPVLSTDASAAIHQATWQASHANLLACFRCY